MGSMGVVCWNEAGTEVEGFTSRDYMSWERGLKGLKLPCIYWEGERS